MHDRPGVCFLPIQGTAEWFCPHQCFHCITEGCHRDRFRYHSYLEQISSSGTAQESCCQRQRIAWCPQYSGQPDCYRGYISGYDDGKLSAKGAWHVGVGWDLGRPDDLQQQHKWFVKLTTGANFFDGRWTKSHKNISKEILWERFQKWIIVSIVHFVVRCEDIFLLCLWLALYRIILSSMSFELDERYCYFFWILRLLNGSVMFT